MLFLKIKHNIRICNFKLFKSPVCYFYVSHHFSFCQCQKSSTVCEWQVVFLHLVKFIHFLTCFIHFKIIHWNLLKPLFYWSVWFIHVLLTSFLNFEQTKTPCILFKSHFHCFGSHMSHVLYFCSQSLEDSIRSRDSAAVGTNTAVKNLEVHHVASLTDLRGRIVRCDTSIAKLSQELRSCFENIKQVGQGQQDQQNRLLDRIHEMESKVSCRIMVLFYWYRKV